MLVVLVPRLLLRGMKSLKSQSKLLCGVAGCEVWKRGKNEAGLEGKCDGSPGGAREGAGHMLLRLTPVSSWNKLGFFLRTL